MKCKYGVTREYWLSIQDGMASPDGISRYVQTVNGSIPGPTIIADWGDNVVVHVTNNLSVNGTTIHFHGMRQNYTNQNDGVPSITQCLSHLELHIPTNGELLNMAPHGIILTLAFKRGRASLLLSDWGHTTVDEQYEFAQTQGPPLMDTGLINGTNVLEQMVLAARLVHVSQPVLHQANHTDSVS
ncbi:hypothetical protein DID88_000028 [Monilinia fructigena]|uniref:Plastocyanin-like domain-containing protein n=1 Tax=Monilinia fructigena TaxID=38457 RepID=A0A395IL47_9HELO|nr:hypothetical protein DID88_000028 [Monilinia fructigena]